MSTRRYHRWTEDDRADIVDRLQAGETLPTVARAYGVSTSALSARLARWGLTVDAVRAATVAARPLRQVAALMGVGDSVVGTWIARGLLRARRNGRKPASARRQNAAGRAVGDRRHLFVHDLDLLAFLSERRAWPSWEPAAITDPSWREAAEEARRAAGGRWVRAADLAARWHYTRGQGERWVRTGRIAGETVRWGLAYYVWEPDGAPLALAPERPRTRMKYAYPLARPCRGCGGTFYVHNARELHKRLTCGDHCRRLAIGAARRARLQEVRDARSHL